MLSAFLFLEKLRVYAVIQGLWRVSPSHRTRCLMQFEATEDDSAWQLLWACKNLEDPKQKAETFMQALEEAHHAELFRNYLNKNTNPPPSRLQVERSPLYLEQSDIWKYFPYCLVGETAASERFSVILRCLPIQELLLKNIFKKILVDEVGHIHKARELAEGLGLEAALLKKEIRNIKLSRAWESWCRSGNKLINPISQIFINSVYFIGFLPTVFYSSIKEKICEL